MVTIACDVCKRKLDNPVVGRDFFFYAKHSICEPCKESLEDQIKPTIRAKEPYTYEWYEKYVGDSLDKAVSKGKI